MKFKTSQIPHKQKQDMKTNNKIYVHKYSNFISKFAFSPQICRVSFFIFYNKNTNEKTK